MIDLKVFGPGFQVVDGNTVSSIGALATGVTEERYRASVVASSAPDSAAEWRACRRAISSVG